MSKKYGRTPHLPNSPGGTKDDVRLPNVLHLVGRPIVILEKMDGGNWCEEPGACYARSHAGNTRNPIFDPAKAGWAGRRHLIEDGTSVFGEWLFYTHSISYAELPAYFLPFNVRNNRTMTWAAWEEVELVASVLSLPTVPVLWAGIATSEKELLGLVETFARLPSACGGEREGVVVRLAGEIADANWDQSIAKWVRESHIQRDPDTSRRNRLATDTRS